MSKYMSKGCKGYCFIDDDKHPDAKKVCNKPGGCRNDERSKRLLRQTSEALLREVERNLY